MSGKSDFVDGEVRFIHGLAVTLFGPADRDVVLMSAGLGGLGSYWKPQLSELQTKYRVVLYDHRGTGKSDRSIQSPFSAASMADDMRLILDDLNVSSANIVGHAAGGIAGLELARTHPERVRSLTVVNGWAVADPYFKRCFEIRLSIFDNEGPHGYLKAQPIFLFPAEWISDHLDILDEQARLHAADFQEEKTLKIRIEALASFDIQDKLTTITPSVLVLSSSDDMLVPARSSKILAKGLPNAVQIEMDWGGHAVNITASKLFNQHLIAFLGSR